MKKIGIVLAFFSSFALGLVETELEQDYTRLVTPFFSLGAPGTLSGRGGMALRYRAFPRTEGKGVIVLVPGYTESLLKYPELIYDLWNSGYGVYVMDHRGMGLSGRSLKNPQIVHVEKFEYYVDDLEKFVNDVVLRDPMSSKLYLGAHSLGGLIAAQLMAKRPHLFRAAVLSAPQFDLHTGNYPRSVAVALAGALTLAGQGNDYAPGFGNFVLETFLLAGSPVTHSSARFDIYKNLLTKVPAIRQGGPDSRWVGTLLHETQANRVELLGGRVRTPMLMIQPTVDSYVKPRGQNLFCGAAWDCRKLVVVGSKHEVFREKDLYRAPALKAALEFLDSH